MRAPHPLRAVAPNEEQALRRTATATRERVDVVHRAQAVLGVRVGRPRWASALGVRVGRPRWASAPALPSRKWKRMRAKCVPHVAAQADALGGTPW